MGNVLDRVDDEIKELRINYKKEKKIKVVPDTLKYRLGEPLIGRIAILSVAFKPYKILEDDYSE